MANFSKAVNAMRTFAGRWRREHVHMVVRGRDSRFGFGIIGSPHVRPHYSRVFLGERDDVVVSSHLHLGDSTRVAESLAKQFGFAVVSEVAISPALEARTLRVPRFISLVMDLGASSEAYHSQLSFSARDDVRRTRKGGFRSEISRDVSWAPEFFERYHRPSVTGRHGDEGFVLPLAEIVRVVRDHGGEFLRVMQGEQCVAALLGYSENGAYCLARLGWLDADPAWVKAGALGAVYWFATLRSRELGFSKMRTGGTPPYLEDGLFRFKMKWNAHLEPDVSVGGENRLLLAPEHPNSRRLLEGRSMLVHGSDGKFFVVSLVSSADVKLPEGVARAITRWFRWRRDDETVAVGANSALPEAMRPWFIEEPAPSS